MFTVANSQLSPSELIGITVSELFGISRLRGRSFFPRRTEAISYERVPNIAERIRQNNSESITPISRHFCDRGRKPFQWMSRQPGVKLSPTLPYLPQPNPRSGSSYFKLAARLRQDLTSEHEFIKLVVAERSPPITSSRHRITRRAQDPRRSRLSSSEGHEADLFTKLVRRAS
jgi:hypothetical protein